MFRERLDISLTRLNGIDKHSQQGERGRILSCLVKGAFSLDMQLLNYMVTDSWDVKKIIGRFRKQKEKQRLPFSEGTSKLREVAAMDFILRH